MTTYWLLLTGILGTLIVASVSKTFYGLITIHGSSSVAMASSSFLNLGDDSKTWNVKKGISETTMLPIVNSYFCNQTFQTICKKSIAVRSLKTWQTTIAMTGPTLLSVNLMEETAVHGRKISDRMHTFSVTIALVLTLLTQQRRPTK